MATSWPHNMQLDNCTYYADRQKTDNSISRGGGTNYSCVQIASKQERNINLIEVRAHDGICSVLIKLGHKAIDESAVF